MTRSTTEHSAVFKEEEAAAYLGLSRATLRRGRMEGKRDRRCQTPPFVRLGRAVRYIRTDLDQWLSEHRVDPAAGRVSGK